MEKTYTCSPHHLTDKATTTLSKPVFEIYSTTPPPIDPNFRSTIVNTVPHPYQISRPGALLLQFLLQ
jgi:hypothetical protein